MLRSPIGIRAHNIPSGKCIGRFRGMPRDNKWLGDKGSTVDPFPTNYLAKTVSYKSVLRTECGNEMCIGANPIHIFIFERRETVTCTLDLGGLPVDLPPMEGILWRYRARGRGSAVRNPDNISWSRANLFGKFPNQAARRHIVVCSACSLGNRRSTTELRPPRSGDWLMPAGAAERAPVLSPEPVDVIVALP